MKTNTIISMEEYRVKKNIKKQCNDNRKLLIESHVSEIDRLAKIMISLYKIDSLMEELRKLNGQKQ